EYEEDYEEDEWMAKEAALDEAEKIQSRTAAVAEAATSVAAVQAGVGTALSAPSTGKKIKPCAFFIAGRCYFGDKCVNSHAKVRDQGAE
ncbi:unnamed protein product, partial [Laminaria digitata]